MWTRSHGARKRCAGQSLSRVKWQLSVRKVNFHLIFGPEWWWYVPNPTEIDDNDTTIAGHPSAYMKGYDIGRAAQHVCHPELS